jgi:hypothetical protein
VRDLFYRSAARIALHHPQYPSLMALGARTARLLGSAGAAFTIRPRYMGSGKRRREMGSRRPLSAGDWRNHCRSRNQGGRRGCIFGRIHQTRAGRGFPRAQGAKCGEPRQWAAIDLWIEGRKVLAGLGKCRYHQISWMAFCTNSSNIKHLVQTVDQEVGGSNPPSCTKHLGPIPGS